MTCGGDGNRTGAVTLEEGWMMVDDADGDGAAGGGGGGLVRRVMVGAEDEDAGVVGSGTATE